MPREVLESPTLEVLETCRMWHLATWLCGRLGSVRLDSAHPAPWHEPTLNSRGLTSTRAAASKPIHQQPGQGSSRPAAPSVRTALALLPPPFPIPSTHTTLPSGASTPKFHLAQQSHPSSSPSHSQARPAAARNKNHSLEQQAELHCQAAMQCPCWQILKNYLSTVLGHLFWVSLLEQEGGTTRPPEDPSNPNHSVAF